MDIPANKKSKRSHFWYAVLSDCYLEEYDAHPPPVLSPPAPARRCPPTMLRNWLFWW
jgi:hypothetical protein